MMMLAALLACGVVVAAGAELAARAWIRRRGEYFVFPPGLRLRLLVDRETHPTLESEVRFEVNSAGERADEPPRTTDGVFHVLYTGGSQAEGFMLDQRSTCPGVLQSVLAQPDTLRALGRSRVHVGSICRSGIGSEALDLVLGRVLPRYPRVDLIIVHVGASDVLGWLERGAPSTMPHPRVADVFHCHPEVAFGWRPDRSAALELLRRIRRRRLRPVDTHRQAGRWYRDVRAMRARATTVMTTMPDASPMLDNFAFYFERLLRKAQAHAGRVMVVRQSWFDKGYTAEEAAHMWHGGVGQVWRENVTTYYSFEVVSGLMALLDTRAAAIADSLGIEQVDLKSIVEPSLETYYDWAHFTPLGARTVAHAIAEAIVRDTQPRVRDETQPPCVDLLAS